MDPSELEKVVREVVERVLSRASAGAGAASPGASSPGAVAIGSDHGGFRLKEELKAFLAGQGRTVLDEGTDSTDPVDYPVYAARVARRVAGGECAFGIAIDGAGIGSCMVANKIPGVRAALCYDLSTARNAREHNDANVLTLGAGLLGPALARDIVTTFLSTTCTEERHRRRVSLIDALDGARARA